MDRKWRHRWFVGEEEPGSSEGVSRILYLKGWNLHCASVTYNLQSLTVSWRIGV